MRDRLGSHLSNLALRSKSQVVMPIETAISGNTYLACQFINENDVSLVYTTPNGRAELVESGCGDSLTYVESGLTIENPKLKYATLPLNSIQFVSLGNSGFQYLVRGFLPPETWGTWAGGYRSLMGLRIPQDLASVELVVGLETHAIYGQGQNVKIRINGEAASQVTMPTKGAREAVVRLFDLQQNQSLEIALECERTDEQVLKDDPVDGPIPCVGVTSLQLRNATF